MTKTYDDIEAVTRLLEEKEKDLELTARIGKELLANNQRLENNVTSLETELRTTNEKLTQLSHELQKKTELIQILTNDEGDSSSEVGTPCAPRQINAEFMQQRIHMLENDNVRLREEFNQIAKDTSECEEAEAKLVQDITHQLSTANREVTALLGELDRQREENRQQTEHIVALEAKLRDIENRHTIMTAENEELKGLIRISRETQDSLSGELADLKTRHAEVSALLLDTQEQLKKKRKMSMPVARATQLFPSLTGINQHNPDSIASELESSLFSELSLDSGISSDRAPSYKKVFETVRCASRSSMGSGSSIGSSLGISPVKRLGSLGGGQASLTSSLSMSSSSIGPRMSSLPGMAATSASSSAIPTHPAPHIYGSTLSFPSLDSAGQSDSEAFSNDSEDNYSVDAEQCEPRSDFTELEAAVRRLTPAAVALRRAHLGSASMLSFDECRTPDSIMSTGSSGAFSGNSNSMNWKLPDKLQIVKPIEGSLTLHHWSQLATPTLSGLLEERPGVKIRGGKPLEELGLDTYTLSDLEEDDEYICPGKSFQSTSSVYTYTNSTVMHPDDMTSVTPSLPPSQMSTRCTNSRASTANPTPVSGMSRRNSTSTFSTCLGLAKMLNERGIKAVTPSALNTPACEKSFSPTATPCNSPLGSPRGSAESSPSSSRSPSPPPYSTFPIPALLSSGAELLRRTFSSERYPSPMRQHRPQARRSKKGLSRSDRKALSSIKLVEKLEQIGLDSLVTPNVRPGARSMYFNPAQRSPMAQLTGLSPVTSKSKPSFVLGGDDDSDIPILGMPAKPGSGQLDSRLNRLQQENRRPSVRTDLGSVPGAPPTPRGARKRPDLGSVPSDHGIDSHSSSTLGTLSSLWFGRKGGLL
ncbi:Trafficking kinesin-binding protein milt [Frankliniella fusca]|uniref:Trafficking kinesin-binding protein milt n=1 Tax=Frankliniella fusca TaxID=407009 RepID=A0AAE1GV60_9NEOP|nr:Trafficking kinesin-binding protein milt [Frankliniella fusca]